MDGSCGGRLVRTSEKGGDGVGNTKCGKGTKVVDIVDSNGIPLAVYLTAANHSEVKLIEPTLDRLQILDKAPEHLIYDRAADSDPLRERLRDERGIELVCPHRKSRKKPPTQDGRACRRYRHRYVVERIEPIATSLLARGSRYSLHSGSSFLECCL
ncbi:transposase [Schlesneria paludicola]|uniref:transposase n=1 Tax=Schlesneria paludicola TaxID=360056 RepID=UPI0012F7C7E2|nr:transposase [Schlesneria paludicola]